MNKVDDLINQLCPHGVTLKTIDDCVYSIRSGLNPRDNFRLDVPDALNFYVTVKEITSGKIVFSDKTSKINDEALSIIQKRSYLERNDVLLSGIGTIGKAALVDIDTSNWNVSESVLLLKPRLDIINPRYLYYLLESSVIKNELINQSVGSTLKGIRMTSLRNALIPVPPLEVQNEIVRILDNFSALEAELEAELEAREKQYRYYLDKLLDFSNIYIGVTSIDKMISVLCPEGVSFKRIGEIGTLVRGNGLQKKDFTDTGTGCIHYGQIYTYYEMFPETTKSFVSNELAKTLKKVDQFDLIITNTSENLEDVCKAVVWMGTNQIVTGGHATILKHSENPKFLAYYLQTSRFNIDKQKYANGTKVIDVSANNLAKIKIPVPPIEIQNEIVKILDNFSTYVSSLSEGLPAEIKARREQYEYYRNKLLTF
jgi:type I restriction enzyme S subunit